MYSQLTNTNYNKSLGPITDIRVNNLYVDGSVFPPIMGPTGPAGDTGATGDSGSEDLIQTRNNFVTYNYQQSTSGGGISLANSYTAPSGSTITNTVPAFPGITQTSNTGISYRPPPRQTAAIVVPFLSSSSLGTTTNSFISYAPSLTAAYNASINYFLASDASGQLYQLRISGAGATAENIMKNYDGTNVAPFTNLTAMTMNIADGLLYYVRSSAPTTVRYYDWTTKSNSDFITGIAYNVRSLYYDNSRSVLYVIGSADGGVTTSYFIPPLDRAIALPTYGMTTDFPQTFTSAGCTKSGFCVDESTGCFYHAINPSAGNSQIIQALPFGSTTALATNTPAAAVTQYLLTQVASGLILAYQVSNRRLYTSRTMTTFNTLRTTVNTYVAICRTPYGIIA